MSSEYPPPGPGQEPEDSPYPPPPPQPQPQPPPQWGAQPPSGQPPQPPQPGYGGYGGYGAPVQTSPLAIVSLVLGILGVPCCVFFVMGIAAVVTGFVARKQISDSQGRLKGDGLALAGIVLGAVAVVAALVLRILSLAGVFDTESYA